MPKFQVTWSENGDDPRSFDYTYDTDVLTLTEAREVKKWTGLNPIQWINDMDDPDSVAALACVLRRRDDEENLRFSDVDLNYYSFKVKALDEPDPQVADSA